MSKQLTIRRKGIFSTNIHLGHLKYRYKIKAKCDCDTNDENYISDPARTNKIVQQAVRNVRNESKLYESIADRIYSIMQFHGIKLASLDIIVTRI